VDARHKAGHDGKNARMIDWFDDLKLGMRFITPERRITREDIVRFAREFDPQPFHTDEAAAEHTVLRGLAASGWHTAASPCGSSSR
jgi:acyl dehydratase